MRLSTEGSLTGLSPKCFLMGSAESKQAFGRDIVPFHISPQQFLWTNLSFY